MNTLNTLNTSSALFRFTKSLSLSIGLSLMASCAWALDPLSFARYDQVKTSALHLDLQADFQKKSLRGTAQLQLTWLDEKAREVVLDTRDLKIDAVQMQDEKGAWKKVQFKMGKVDSEKGQALSITLPSQAKNIKITYQTSPQASALQWLTPAQTMSGKRPYMFSQSQTIHARSWVPIQDTPAVRFTYSANVKTPAGLRAVMSAENDAKGDGKGGWKFTMPQAIPAYLLAIAIGEIEVRQLGPRTAVYAEPQRIKAAEYEFADTEKMIDAASNLYGPYRWGRYDMLVLPPSFPIGGMENPRLTFLTPTMIAGDRSLVDLIAHELAHSWSGNLATNSTWKHFWLNEGFTTYVTTRITEEIYGPEVALMNLQLEQQELFASLPAIPAKKQAFITRDADENPSETYTDDGLIYPKGAWFLHTLEQRAGRAVFDPFLRSWFDQHAFQSVDTAQFISFLKANLLSKNPAIMSDAELDEWIYGSGIPASAKRAESPRLAALDQAKMAWLDGKLATTELPVKKWNATESMYFLNYINNKANAKQLQELDQAFQLGKTENKEIAFRFYLASINANYAANQAGLEGFLMSVGRKKFVLPLYSALLKNPTTKQWAQNLYNKAKPRYHPETQAGVNKLMKAVQK